jgi:hypothetical protein
MRLELRQSMNLKWRSKNIIVCLAVVSLLATVIIQVLNQEEVPSLPRSTTSVSDNIKSTQTTIDRVSVEQMEQASMVNLQRMLKPEPLPIAPTPEPTVAIVPPQAFIFGGTLLGTMVDRDPIQSYAIIRLANSQVRLIRNGGFIDEPSNEVQLIEVASNQVTIKHLPTDTESIVEAAVLP